MAKILVIGGGAMGSAFTETNIQAQGYDYEDGNKNDPNNCANILNDQVLDSIFAKIDQGIKVITLALPCQTWTMARKKDKTGKDPLRGDTETEIWGLPFAASNWTTGDWPGGADIAYYNNLRGSYGTHPRLLGPYKNSTYVRFHIFDNQDDTGYNQYNHIFTNNTILIAYGQYYTG